MPRGFNLLNSGARGCREGLIYLIQVREDAARDGCIYLPQNDNQAINKAINAPSKLQVHKLTARGLKNGSFRRNI